MAYLKEYSSLSVTANAVALSQHDLLSPIIRLQCCDPEGFVMKMPLCKWLVRTLARARTTLVAMMCRWSALESTGCWFGLQQSEEFRCT